MSRLHIPIAALFAVVALVTPHYDTLLPEACKVLTDDRVTFRGLKNVMAIACALLGALLFSHTCALYTLTFLLSFYVAASFCLLDFNLVPSFKGKAFPFIVNHTHSSNHSAFNWELLAYFAIIIPITIVFLIKHLAFPHDPLRWRCPHCTSTNGVFVQTCEGCQNDRVPPIL